MSDTKINTTKPTIFIPVAGFEKLIRYQEGIRGLLRRIEIGSCDPALKENIKAVYELLSLLRHNRGAANGDNPKAGETRL